ncbi:MAG TPA: acetate/propionate family kinase [Acidimicrobiales bacterium]|nr:acetate/propionate family kinase [Acidimicrobiales bacterium]
MRVLVVNAGSSNLKLRLLGHDDEVLAERDVPVEAGQFDGAAAASFVRDVGGGAEAVGHRVVHGGARFSGPVELDARVVTELEALASLAPLHQAAALAGIELIGGLLPRVPAVASFDTAFHATLPPAASTYAVPEEWRSRLGVRRFGFHGLSHAYASRRAAAILGRPPLGTLVVTCHLGSGASVAAVSGGRSVDTTMGFTPLEGLVMATRSGSVDPGLVLWLVQEAGLEVSEVARALEHGSGLLSLAGTADMAEVERAVDAGDPSARTALDVYVHRLRGAVAAMAAAMGGLDAVAFTGGVGENSARVRAEVAAGLGFLGLELDLDLNARPVSDSDVSRQDAAVRVLVLRAREDLEIAGEVRALLG